MVKAISVFSLEKEIIDDFYDLIKEKSLNKNREMEKILKEYLKIKIEEIKNLECSVCGCFYTNKLKECPNCNFIKRGNIRIEALEEERKKLSDRYEKFKKLLETEKDENWIKIRNKQLEDILLKIKEIDEKLVESRQMKETE